MAEIVVRYAQKDALDNADLDAFVSNLAQGIHVASGAAEALAMAVAAKSLATETAADLTTHKADTTAHGATDAADENTIALRGAGGALQVGTPVEATHAAPKGYVDALVTNLITGGEDGSGALVIDAPADGQTYGRRDNAWAVAEAVKQNVLVGAVGSAESTLPVGRAKDLALVDGLGLFKFFPASTALVDGELCIAARDGVGRWELILPNANVVLALVEDRVNTALSSEFVQVLSATASLSFGVIAAQKNVDKTVTVAGAAVGSLCSVIPPAALPGTLICTAWVSAVNTVTVRLCNLSASSITPVTAAYTVNVFAA